jgi:hypothetical protein
MVKSGSFVPVRFQKRHGLYQPVEEPLLFKVKAAQEKEP